MAERLVICGGFLAEVEGGKDLNAISFPSSISAGGLSEDVSVIAALVDS